MNVKLVRLINGEEIIADVVEESSGKLTLKNPLRVLIAPSQTNPNTPQVFLVPWCEFTSDKAVLLDKNHILAIMTPVDEFTNQYKSKFGGIVTPVHNLIIPKGV